MLDKAVIDYANGLYMGMFAEAENTTDAITYAYNLIETLPPEYKAGAYTGLHVLLNTVAQELRRLVREDEDE